MNQCHYDLGMKCAVTMEWIVNHMANAAANPEKLRPGHTLPQVGAKLLAKYNRDYEDWRNKGGIAVSIDHNKRELAERIHFAGMLGTANDLRYLGPRLHADHPHYAAQLQRAKAEQLNYARIVDAGRVNERADEDAYVTHRQRQAAAARAAAVPSVALAPGNTPQVPQASPMKPWSTGKKVGVGLAALGTLGALGAGVYALHKYHQGREQQEVHSEPVLLRSRDGEVRRRLWRTA